jgi:hypothetical protein
MNGMKVEEQTLRQLALDPSDEMIKEARQIVEAARERGIVLRLIGGMAVRSLCTDQTFCARPHADIDMAGLFRQVGETTALMQGLGYRENTQVRLASDYRQRQFVRPCRHVHPETGHQIHEDDHVDVFLDALQMDHNVPLKDRLELDDFTVPRTDLLLTKLQVHRRTGKDVRDILALLKDSEVAYEDRPGAIDASYIARLCAGDWGMYYDVVTSIDVCERMMDDFELSDADRAQIVLNASRLIGALDAAPKTLAWRLRARVGTRIRWHQIVEEQD